MFNIGIDIGVPGELVSSNESNMGKYIRYTIDNYCDISKEYELSNSISVIYLDKYIVESRCKIKEELL